MVAAEGRWWMCSKTTVSGSGRSGRRAPEFEVMTFARDYGCMIMKAP